MKPWTMEARQSFSEEELAKFAEFDFIRLTLADINGIARGKVVPREAVEGKIRHGSSCYAGMLTLSTTTLVPNITEIASTGHKNAVIYLMPATIRHLPWAGEGLNKIGEVLCEMYWQQGQLEGQAHEACTRHMAEKQLKRLHDLGYDLFSAFEAEFYVFKEGILEGIFPGSDAFSQRNLSSHEPLLYYIYKNLRRLGCNVQSILVEYGSGQFEFSLAPQFGIEMGDSMFRLKQFVKEMCRQKGYQATFMTKPNANCSGSGMHFNHSLWTKDRKANAFYDDSASQNFSSTGYHWLAGLLRHADALAALTSPTVNCYRRLHKPFAPDLNNWGFDDRTTAFRVKTLDESETYIENRLPSGAANPYVVLAATVAAGLDGIESKLECPTDKKKMKTPLPYSLETALDALEKDEVMVKALGKQFVKWFVQLKRDTEVTALKGKGIDDERLTYISNI